MIHTKFHQNLKKKKGSKSLNNLSIDSLEVYKIYQFSTFLLMALENVSNKKIIIIIFP